MARTDIRLDDHGQIARVQRELRRFGDKSTRRKYYAGLNRATKPMKIAAKANAARALPKRGGLNRRVAANRLTTRSSRGGVFVTEVGRSQGRLIDQGYLRHPVYGNRSVWVTQTVPGGWFTVPMKAGAPAGRRELIAVFNDVAHDIARRTTA